MAGRFFFANVLMIFAAKKIRINTKMMSAPEGTLR
jgi:hypothetical protein